MRIKAIVLFFVFISGFSAFGQNLPDTVRIPLSKVDMPVSYCSSDWMGYNKELVRDPADPTRINKVRTKLRKDFPISIDFSNAGSVTYSFPEGYTDITVPADSMRLYRKRVRLEAEGPTPEWNIGNYRKNGKDFSVWVMPDGVATLTADSTEFLNNFLIRALIGNVYDGTIDTPDGPFSVTVHYPADKADSSGIFPYPAIITKGKYENFSDFVPEITFGMETSRVRGLGAPVKLGAEDYYIIDSLTPGDEELKLIKAKTKPEKMRISDKAMEELKPYMEKAAAHDRLLLVDFWGTWCRPCIGAMPKLKELEEKFADRIAVLSVINDAPDNFERGKGILDRHGLTGDRLFREKEPLVFSLKVNAFPTYILLDRDGSIIMRGSSADALDWIENYLDSEEKDGDASEVKTVQVRK